MHNFSSLIIMSETSHRTTLLVGASENRWLIMHKMVASAGGFCSGWYRQLRIDKFSQSDWRNDIDASDGADVGMHPIAR